MPLATVHTRTLLISLLLCVLSCLSLYALDINGDGMIRVTLISQDTHAGGISAAEISGDLEMILKAAHRNLPVRVAHESLAPCRTLWGWWHHPESRAVRERVLSGANDYFLLAESEDIVMLYPELFFEGVRSLSEAAQALGTRVAVLLLCSPGNSFRDRRYLNVAESVYRVCDGCGVEVVPAAFAWNEALTRNRIEGNSPIKARANGFLAAASTYLQLTGQRFPKAALESEWTTRRGADALAASARQGLAKARVRQHYKGVFSGVVRVEPRIQRTLSIYGPNLSSDSALDESLKFILASAAQEWFWKSPKEWYAAGFDRYSMPFDLVYGDMQQMSQLLDETLYTTHHGLSTNFPPPLTMVFTRNPGDDNSTETILRLLEPLLMDGYDFARKNRMIFIPYQVAWARAHHLNPALTADNGTNQENDWLAYMLANMLYTALCGRCQVPDERPKPKHANKQHPFQYHDQCARIAYDTMLQLSTLRAPVNALLVRAQNYFISDDNPGFVNLRLRDKPERDTIVYCAANLPDTALLSQSRVVFTPANYDIEQSIRLLPATTNNGIDFVFMAAAHSRDETIDCCHVGVPFLMRHDQEEKAVIQLDREVVAPGGEYEVRVRLVRPPIGIVKLSVRQNRHLTDVLYLTPRYYADVPLRLCPTAVNHATGRLALDLSVSSDDLRYNNLEATFNIGLPTLRQPLPVPRIVAPRDGEVVEGPDFVTARADVPSRLTLRSLEIFMGSKLLGQSNTTNCVAAVELSPPPTRLPEGQYRLWAKATTREGVPVASETSRFSVQARKTP